MARRMAGRGKKGKRLGNPASKMATSLMADTGVDNECYNRPFHEASTANKIICPESKCVEKLLFFEENGLGQHCRVIHKHDADFVKASSTMRYLYGQETLKYICILSENKSKVSIFKFYELYMHILCMNDQVGYKGY